MQHFSLAGLLDRRRASSGPWLEILAVPDMSVGLYVLGAGAIDPQQPHTEDETYVVVAGRSLFTAADETVAVAPGDTIFVPAGVAHRFHDITEELQVIVVFGPREGSRAG